MTSGLVAWYSPPGRCLNQPGFSSRATSAWPARCRSRASQASSSNPIPPSGDEVPAKQRSTTSSSRPTASKIWAPR